MNELQTELFKGVMLGYSDIVVSEQSEFKDELWWKHAARIRKYFHKRKKKGYKDYSMKWLKDKYEEVKLLDAEHFENKGFSAYLSMLLILNYLIVEENDSEMRVRFGDINTGAIINEMETTDWLKESGSISHSFISKLLKLVGA